MGSRSKLAVTFATLCSVSAAGAAFYALRRREAIHIDPVTTPTDGNLTLINVNVLFRHGARTPLTAITGLEEV